MDLRKRGNVNYRDKCINESKNCDIYKNNQHFDQGNIENTDRLNKSMLMIL